MQLLLLPPTSVCLADHQGGLSLANPQRSAEHTLLITWLLRSLLLDGYELSASHCAYYFLTGALLMSSCSDELLGFRLRGRWSKGWHHYVLGHNLARPGSAAGFGS